MCGVVDGYYMLLGSLGYNLDDISIFFATCNVFFTSFVGVVYYV